MHRRTLYENVDSAKIKVSFYTIDMDILRMALMHRIVIHCIDISMNRYTPTDLWSEVGSQWSVSHLLCSSVCRVSLVLKPHSSHCSLRPAADTGPAAGPE